MLSTVLDNMQGDQQTKLCSYHCPFQAFGLYATNNSADNIIPLLMHVVSGDFGLLSHDHWDLCRHVILTEPCKRMFILC